MYEAVDEHHEIAFVAQKIDLRSKACFRKIQDVGSADLYLKIVWLTM